MEETEMKIFEKNTSRFVWAAVLMLALAMPMILNAAVTQAKSQSSAPVDLNNATQEEITAIKGIGPATAKKIIANRPYNSVEELKKAGLSAKKIEAIRPLVTVGLVSSQGAPAKNVAPALSPQKESSNTPPANAQKPAAAKAKLAPGQKVDINTADEETLQALPGIGPAKAKAIIAGRPYAKIEDIMKVKGIKQGVFNKIKDSITVK
jgi:competence protein ComEA